MGWNSHFIHGSYDRSEWVNHPMRLIQEWVIEPIINLGYTTQFFGTDECSQSSV